MERLISGGFATLTMAELAARLNCSLRTLYALAPSRDELVLIVVDRSLWRVGRGARDAVRDDLAPLDAVRAYLEAATVAVSGWTEAFARDLAAVPAAQELEEGHNEYLFDVTRTLLDLAVERGDVADLDTAAVARVLAGLGRFFSRPRVISGLESSPKEAADQIVDLVLRGLRNRAGEARTTGG
jgi:AcrR family transcriptional regulator